MSFLFVLLIFPPFFPEKENHTPGQIKDLADLLAEDCSALDSVREMGLDTSKFFHEELKKSWGSAHLAVFDGEEASNWILGVSILTLYVQPRGHWSSLLPCY